MGQRLKLAVSLQKLVSLRGGPASWGRGLGGASYPPDLGKVPRCKLLGWLSNTNAGDLEKEFLAAVGEKQMAKSKLINV